MQYDSSSGNFIIHSLPVWLLCVNLLNLFTMQTTVYYCLLHNALNADS